ncbi:beta strand repeat-containing protein, partial [Sporomusa malonica]
MQRKWKRRWQRVIAKAILPVAAGMLLLSAYSPALANPTGGTVANGSASIATSGSTMIINQATNKAVINWQSFSIGKGEIVNFVQPSSTAVALNRVVGNNVSSIYGSLNANGKVYLVNPNGILFSSSAQVNVGGLVASTLNISDSDFTSGKYTFEKNGSGGSVTNAGSITATNEAVLIGPTVTNEGVITAKVVGLGAGDKVSLDFSGDQLLNVAVDTGAAGGSAKNSGTITSTGGLVVMTAGTKDALLNTVVNNSGVIRAQSIANVNGVICLEGGNVINRGTLDVSGKTSGQTGGAVKVLGDTVTLASGSTIDVSGDAGGGTALIGGAYQGGSHEYAATSTTVETGTLINADAITTGNGGQVVVWANDTTNFAGKITAKGGSISGNGGNVETSGHILTVSGTVLAGATNGNNGCWLLDPYDYTINSAAAASLVTSLDSNTDVTVRSSDGTSGTDGNIYVNSALNWTGTGTLTLSAYNNINLNSSISAANGGLMLAANTSGSGNGTTTGIIVPASGSSISVGTFNLQSGTWREITGSISAFYAKDFRSSGGTFIRALSGTGASTSPYQIADVYGLQGAGSSGMIGNYYTLANDIDAGGTQDWNSGAGFVPIGNDTVDANNFTGGFNGGGHTISNLYISRSATTHIGLFGYSTGTIRNLGLIDATIIGNKYVGALVGYTGGGTITNCYVAGTSTVTGAGDVGGLTGDNYGTITNCYSDVTAVSTGSTTGGLVGCNKGLIEDSHSTGNVTGTANVGGLVGYMGNTVGTITDCYATGNVTGSGYYVGGLVGYSKKNTSGSISNCYSTGDVTGAGYVGGLVGRNEISTISGCYSTGDVTMAAGTATADTWSVGGLIGYNTGNITDCYATGDVVSRNGSTKYGASNLYACAGGLVGDNASGNITSCYSTGTVTSTTGRIVGGLVGWLDSGTVSQCYHTTGAITGSYVGVGGLVGSTDSGTVVEYSYNTAAVKGLAWVGGLIGYNSGMLRYSYNTGAISGTGSGYYYFGGLVGVNDGSITECYNIGSLDGAAGNVNIGGVSGSGGSVTGCYWSTDNNTSLSNDGLGLTLAQMMQKGSFSGWDIATTGGSSSVWRIYEGYTCPLLRNFLTSLTVSANSGSREYDGTTDALGFAYSITPDSSLLLGTVTGATAGKNVGTYTVTPDGLYSSQQGYDISYSSGTVTITPRTLTVSGLTAADKIYDGGMAATVDTSAAALVNTVAGESVSLSIIGATGTFDDKNVGTDKTVTVSGLTLSGTDAGNYTLTANTTADVTAKIITVGGLTAGSRVYDGTTAAAVSGTLDGVISSDTVTLSSGTFDTKNVGTGKTVTVASGNLSGADAGNYTLTTANTTADVTAKTITVSGLTADSRVYDGTTAAAVSGTLDGVISGDTVTLTSGTFDTKNAGTGKTVTVTSGDLNGTDAGNYTLTATTTADITA